MKGVVAIVLVAAVGCGGGGGDDSPYVSDAAASSDALPASDAPAQLHGLLVTWRTMPALPGQVDNDVIVTSATFQLERLQVIGDNGQPMTTTPKVLHWGVETVGDPETIAFATAPSGLYSQITLDIDITGGGNGFEIRGMTKVGSNMEPFYVHDTDNLDVDVKNYNVSLAPGGDATMAIKIDVKDALKDIDWAMVPVNNGTRELDHDDNQMSGFRDGLKDSFKRGP